MLAKAILPGAGTSSKLQRQSWVRSGQPAQLGPSQPDAAARCSPQDSQGKWTKGLVRSWVSGKEKPIPLPGVPDWLLSISLLEWHRYHKPNMSKIRLQILLPSNLFFPCLFNSSCGIFYPSSCSDPNSEFTSDSFTFSHLLPDPLANLLANGSTFEMYLVFNSVFLSLLPSL